jgi:hypothetical protein
MLLLDTEKAEAGALIGLKSASGASKSSISIQAQGISCIADCARVERHGTLCLCSALRCLLSWQNYPCSCSITFCRTPEHPPSTSRSKQHRHEPVRAKHDFNGFEVWGFLIVFIVACYMAGSSTAQPCKRNVASLKPYAARSTTTAALATTLSHVQEADQHRASTSTAPHTGGRTAPTVHYWRWRGT